MRSAPQLVLENDDPVKTLKVPGENDELFYDRTSLSMTPLEALVTGHTSRF